MFGFTGKLLRVNLTDKTIKRENLNIKDAREFLGSRGWARK